MAPAKKKSTEEDEVERDPDTGAPLPLEPLPANLPKGAKESEAVYDPVDEYPERPYAEASAGVHQVIPHTEDGRRDTLQLVQDPETGNLARAEGVEGVITNTDYEEEVVMIDGQKVGYVAPVYD